MKAMLAVTVEEEARSSVGEPREPPPPELGWPKRDERSTSSSTGGLSARRLMVVSSIWGATTR